MNVLQLCSLFEDRTLKIDASIKLTKRSNISDENNKALRNLQIRYETNTNLIFVKPLILKELTDKSRDDLLNHRQFRGKKVKDFYAGTAYSSKSRAYTCYVFDLSYPDRQRHLKEEDPLFEERQEREKLRKQNKAGVKTARRQTRKTDLEMKVEFLWLHAGLPNLMKERTEVVTRVVEELRLYTRTSKYDPSRESPPLETLALREGNYLYVPKHTLVKFAGLSIPHLKACDVRVREKPRKLVITKGSSEAHWCVVIQLTSQPEKNLYWDAFQTGGPEGVAEIWDRKRRRVSEADGTEEA